MNSVEYNEIMEALKVINKKLDRLNREDRRFTSRQEIIAESGSRRFYDEGVNSGWLHPQKGRGKNATVRIERKEYEAYIAHLKL